MADSLQEQYASLPYPKLVHRFTHPTALAAVAHLYGMVPAAPERARVLDIGTGRGTNLLWIASTLPGAACLGLDLVEEAVSEARGTASRRGIDNARFDQADVLTYDLGEQRFDYIVIHGVLSYVPPDVQDRLFAICRDHLAPNGIGMISYNAMPGWGSRDVIRRLMLLELESIPENAPTGGGDDDPRLAAVDRVLRFFESVLPEISQRPQYSAWADVWRSVRKKDPVVTLHDEVGLINEAFYLMQVASWINDTGLAYVGDAMLKLDWLEAHPRPLPVAIAEAGLPRMKALQYADAVHQTMFRRSVVCRAEDASGLAEQPVLERIEGLWATSMLVPAGPVAFAPGRSLGYHMTADSPLNAWRTLTEPVFQAMTRLETDDPLEQAALSCLAKRGERGMAVTELIDEAGRITKVDHPVREKILGLIARCLVNAQMTLSLGPLPPPWPTQQ